MIDNRLIIESWPRMRKKFCAKRNEINKCNFAGTRHMNISFFLFSLTITKSRSSFLRRRRRKNLVFYWQFRFPSLDTSLPKWMKLNKSDRFFIPLLDVRNESLSRLNEKRFGSLKRKLITHTHTKPIFF